ncbi:restriction endonuclease subunit S [Methylobacter sp. Wu1]|uniref:restriction endonuclease subunit S n=1 Tax=Methylobacter sp. Wu1 TaxID=3119359 RepID=UPI002F9452B7
MSKQTKRALVPELRFPEFLDAREWEVKRLGSIGSFVRGLTYSAADVSERGLLVLRSSNIQEGSLVLDKDLVFVSKSCPNELALHRGDIVICMSNGSKALVGKNAEYVGNYPNPITIGAFCSFFRPRSQFAKYIFQTDRYLSFVSFSIGGGNINNLKNSDLEEFTATVPKDVGEQQKIADCLSSLDELITSQTQKLAALKAHKKGLMQQLFPAEGETVPKLRFPEFRNDGKWKEYLLGKLIKVNSGKGFKASEYSKIGIRLLQIENVGYGAVKWNDKIIFLPQSYSVEYPELVLHEGNIVLALNRPVTNNELKIARLRKEDEPSLLYQRVGKLELLSDAVNEDFCFHLCRTFIKDFVEKQSIGSDQPFISIKDLYAQKIFIPSPLEQQKIADCLSSLDELISAQTQKLAALKAHKKGLMQQLFPAVEQNNEKDL